MKLPKDLTTVTPLSKTIALIMFAFLPVIGFYAGVWYQQEQSGSLQATAVPQSVLPEVEEEALPSVQSCADTVDTSKWRSYKHSVLGYTIKYPDTWQLHNFAVDETKNIFFEEFNIESPDYKEYSEFPGRMEIGSRMSVSVADTKDSLASRKKAGRLGLSSINYGIQVSEQEAFQYAWTYEGVNATSTEMIANGKWYLIQFSYDRGNANSNYSCTYDALVKSFKLS